MADNSEAVPAVITQGQTTSVAEGAQPVQAEPAEDRAEQAEQPASGIWNNWLLYAAIGMWVWWLLTNKKRKAQRQAEQKEKERKNTLLKGDRLVTIGRLHGTVVAFTDDTVTVKPDAKSDLTLTFDRQAIFRILPRPGEEREAGADGAKEAEK
ncbi:MAG: preprotein translocase subunit YajC [Planctomycetota bacterium]|nr:preprotein translocase subunit YajC [Planctomycetota bacterium]